uniref:Uncharacterized protein n=1 Tax=uncultured marine virus TaxID=186617 RepID=A0A0F7L659_9VIRU|nr:hypothetical protein [uncultured marine virus]
MSEVLCKRFCVVSLYAQSRRIPLAYLSLVDLRTVLLLVQSYLCVMFICSYYITLLVVSQIFAC